MRSFSCHTSSVSLPMPRPKPAIPAFPPTGVSDGGPTRRIASSTQTELQAVRVRAPSALPGYERRSRSPLDQLSWYRPDPRLWLRVGAPCPDRRRLSHGDDVPRPSPPPAAASAASLAPGGAVDQRLRFYPVRRPIWSPSITSRAGVDRGVKCAGVLESATRGATSRARTPSELPPGRRVAAVVVAEDERGA